VLYRQQRIGLNGQPFDILKLRTMTVGAEHQGAGYEIGHQDSRITRVGQHLRRWSLDELPQLVNVLRGEMALVGPRPTLGYQVEQYTPRQRGRLAMRPGLTGLAQVRGRNALSWEQRIELDLWYVEHWSLHVDVRILLRTPAALLRGEGIYGRDGGVRGLS
jgi:lipopolysaccharide/colanic/teichoic acid biosynthesis glycosyltransferase